ncbi:MAG TPA: benzoate-CoA ligase family protein [Candidatus Binatia bacterium]|nr:benzoate-CoA ligase family protein [Candidatus Binatia bacterium]
MALPEGPIPEHLNMTAHLADRQVAEGRGGRVAYQTDDGPVTYAELAALQNRCGNLLAAGGVEMENRVALILYDSQDAVAAFLGAMKIGAVPIVLNPYAPIDLYVYFLNDSRAKALIVEDAVWQHLASRRAELKALKHVVVRGESRAEAVALSAALSSASLALEPAATHKNDMSYWLYTSGSTGLPKAVLHLHHDPYSCLQFATPFCQFDETAFSFCFSKMFFALGMFTTVFLPLASAAKALITQQRPTPAETFALLRRHRPTHFYCVPTFLNAMLQVPEADDETDLGFLRYCACGGEPLPPRVYHEWRERFGVEWCDIMGLTETTFIALGNRPGQVRPGSSGRPTPGTEARLVDDNGREVPVGQEGHLWLKMDSIMPGYWLKQERTRAVLEGEWLRTGDLYRKDEDGYFWFCGRSDDMLKTSGMWVSPLEIEGVLMEHPAVYECAVVARRDTDGLDKVRAVVVLKAGYDETVRQELEEHVQGKLPRYKVPRWLEFADALPKTATGKIQRFALRQADRE